MTTTRIKSIMAAINAMGLTAKQYTDYIMVSNDYDGPYPNKDTFAAIYKLQALCKRRHLYGECRGHYNGFLIKAVQA